MTEDEAKTKWCPFARCVAGKELLTGAQTSSETPTFNRVALPDGYTIPHGAKCAASACMVWQWSRTPGQAALHIPKAEAHGQCGLAGAPS